MDYSSFSTCKPFFHFIGYSLRLSGLGFNGFFLFLNLQLLLPLYCLFFKAVGFRIWWFFFCFSTCFFFFYFIAYGLRPSGLGFDGLFLFSDLLLLCPFIWLWFKAVGFRLWWLFFVFQLTACFSILLPMV